MTKLHVKLDLHSAEEILKLGLMPIPGFRRAREEDCHELQAIFLAEWILSENNMNETNKRETKSVFLS